MATKKDSATLKKVAPDEPIFVLRAQDMLAPDAVRGWAFEARRRGLSRDRFQEALAVADAMEKWPQRRLPN
jgi:hypothetical protein